MEKSLHICSIKKPCRIQIIFGLCLAMLFTFLAPSFNTSASYPYTSWGAFDGSGDPVQMFDNNVDVSLSHMIELSFNQTVVDSTDLSTLGVSYSRFISSLSYYGLSNLLGYWQAGNPSYFLNITYVTSDSKKGFILYYAKSNGKYTYDPVVVNNNLINLNNSSPIYFGYQLDFLIQTDGSLGTVNGASSSFSQYSKSLFKRNQMVSNVEDSGDYIIGGSNVHWIIDDVANSIDVLNRFSSFLNDYEQYLFCVFVPDINYNPNVNLMYYVNISIKPKLTIYPIFSTIFSYDISSDLSFSTDNGIFLPVLNRFSTGIVLQDFNDCFSYGYLYGGNSGIATPTPVPTFAWNTPTPFPSVTFIPATLTPIVVQYDPYIYGSDDTWDNLAGYLGILNAALKSPVNRFFSTIMQVTYSFSDWFKFMLVVPIICLFAFIIGRLKRK